jgi:hypothetical protein
MLRSKEVLKLFKNREDCLIETRISGLRDRDNINSSIKRQKYK